MTDEKTGSGHGADLRRRAEEEAREKAARMPENVESLSPDEVRRLLHELRVHQIELEMQNEELRRTQGDLEASRARYFDLYDLAPVGYFTLDEKGIAREVNLTASSMLGVGRRDLLKQPISRFILREDQDIYYMHRKRLFETKEAQVCELRMARKDGDPFWVRIDAVLAQNADGAPVCRAAMSDITRLRTAAEALRESEEHFRALSENAPDIIYTIDFEGAFTYVNPAWKRILGHEKKEVIGKYFTDFAKEENRRTYRKLFKSIRDEGKTVTDHIGSMLTQSGEERLFILNSASNRNTEGQLINVVGSMKDITEMRKIEAQLLQAMKMEALGTLAGGIAHDFNNLLMGIQGNASLALMDLDSSYPQFEYLKSIESEVRSAANLTKQLLGLASIGRYEVKPTDMNKVMEKVVSMFGRMKKEIVIRWKYGEDLWPVEADRGQMEQVFMNLFVNAWQAMPGGGNLFIETKNRILDEDDVTPYTAVPGRYVKLSVTDTGVGMDEKTRLRIFEPFFTTKEMGRGTGLGLSIVYGIIKGHKGFIHVYSEQGQGTTFNIYLPASGKEIFSEKPVSSEIVPGKGTLLLVDDEASVLRVNTRMLERLGYTVLPASNGEEALALYREKRGGIDLVLLDLVMPGMSGGQVFDSLREMDPDIKVILLSGYSIDGEAHTIIERGCNGFLQKPVSLSELSRKIKDVLDT